MTSPPKLRPAIEQRLSLPSYQNVWARVEAAFVNEDWEDERDYWDLALGLRDSWTSMSRAPEKEVKKTVSEIAQLARSLAYKIQAQAPELKTLKGFLDIDQHSFMVEDLLSFAGRLEQPSAATEAMQSRPRRMATLTAERTYMTRALTRFILDGEISGGRIKSRDSLVAMTVCALLDIGSNDEFDAKDVADLTKDIVARYAHNKRMKRLASSS